MSVNALIIGCGNIGSQYDLKNNFVQTHSKAMFLSNWINNVDLYDLDTTTSIKISKLYGFNVLKDYSKDCLNNYDIVSICTPTNTHFKFLKDCILKNVKVVICEKPISFSSKELSELLALYNDSSTKIIINYFRSLQCSYFLLKKKINSLNLKLKSVKINYYKGVLNYASHAFDLINYLFDQTLNIENLNITSKSFDFFKKDPTINAEFWSNGINFHLNGLVIEKPLFEIELKFENHKILILNHGDEAYIYKKNDLLFSEKFLTKNYMSDVLNFSKKIFFEEKFEDNFVKSLNLNKELIKII